METIYIWWHSIADPHLTWHLCLSRAPCAPFIRHCPSSSSTHHHLPFVDMATPPSFKTFFFISYIQGFHQVVLMCKWKISIQAPGFKSSFFPVYQPIIYLSYPQPLIFLSCSWGSITVDRMSCKKCLSVESTHEWLYFPLSKHIFSCRLTWSHCVPGVWGRKKKKEIWCRVKFR